MSYTIDIFTSTGIKNETIELPAIFVDDQINEGLVHEYVVMYLANKRQNTAKTKTRAEVSYARRKLFKQKGTGRARVGDANSPIRRKGGVAFGPSNERNRTKKMNQRTKQKALLSALLLQLQGGSVQGVQELPREKPKTKDATSVLQALGVPEKKVLLVLDGHNEIIYKSRRNIPNVSITTLDMLNPYDIMTHTHIVVTKQSIIDLPKRFHLLAH